MTDISSNVARDSIPLSYTPRSLARHPEEALFYVSESDNNVMTPAARLQLQNDPKLVNGDAMVLPPETFGYPRAKGHWSSCVQIVDPVSEHQVVHTMELEDNEAITSMTLAPFASQDDETFLVLGTGKDMTEAPRSFSGAFVHVYRLNDSGRSLEFIHKTKVEEPPRALLAFQGRILAAIGTQLRLYDLGMKQIASSSLTSPTRSSTWFTNKTRTSSSRSPTMPSRDGLHVRRWLTTRRLPAGTNLAISGWSGVRRQHQKRLTKKARHSTCRMSANISTERPQGWIS